MELGHNRNGYACLTFDFDGPSLWIQRGMTAPTPVSRGEFGAVAVPRLLRLLERRGIPATFFIPGHTMETYPDECRMIVDAGCEVALSGDATVWHGDSLLRAVGPRAGRSKLAAVATVRSSTVGGSVAAAACMTETR